MHGAAVILSAFFEAAKNAAVPNITGERDLLAGNALMFSSRFLLMSFGAALGGWTAATVGYRAAFIVNAVSFLGSAFPFGLFRKRKPENCRAKRTCPKCDRMCPKSDGTRSRVTGQTFAKVVVHHQPRAGCGDSSHQRAVGQRRRCDQPDIGSAGRHCLRRRVSGESAATPRSRRSTSPAGLGLFIGMMIAGASDTILSFRQDARASSAGVCWFRASVCADRVMPNLWLACLFLFLSRICAGR